MLKKTPKSALGVVLAAAATLVTLQSRPALTAADVKAVDGATLKKVAAAPKGKVTIVNLWATWCGPCVEEFPDLVKLHNNYKDKGLNFISVTIDEPEDRNKVVSFINQQKASFPVYIRRGGDVEKFVGALDKGWTGAVPTTYFFDRQGKPFGKPITGLRSYAQFEKAVQSLL